MTAAAALRPSPAPAPFDPRQFHLPAALEASAPPEARGLARDAVRLLVARRNDGQLTHARFPELPRLLEAGDVLVVNTSATLPASLDAEAAGQPAPLHLSGRLPGGLWMVELRHQVAGAIRFDPPGARLHPPGVQPRFGTETRQVETVAIPYGTPGSPATSAPWLDAAPGTVVALPGGARAELRMPATAGTAPGHPVRLWVAALDLHGPVLPYLARYGRPIRYSYVPHDWPIASYQTVFAEVPGSAEMPSAARPFSAEVITRLVSRGIGIAPFVLHCGVSSPEQHETPAAEWYRVPATTAAQINAARQAGGRIIAVGTTAVRALEIGCRRPRRDPSRRRVDRTGGPRRPHRPFRRRAVNRLARAGCVSSGHARGDRRSPGHRGVLHGGPGGRVPLARVRRQPSGPAVSEARPRRDRRTEANVRAHRAGPVGGGRPAGGPGRDAGRATGRVGPA